MSLRDTVDKLHEFKRQITNLKSTLRRRRKRLNKTFDPLERQQIELEIELLIEKIRRLEMDEMAHNLDFMEKFLRAMGDSEEPDWRNAGKA